MPVLTIEPVGPTTTLEQDRASLGHRRINMVWEITQAFIAISVVTANLLAAFYLKGQDTAALSNAFFLVIGFYFGRTNHTRASGGAQSGR